MKKITCISYHNTGSGAVDDFLREFKNLKFGPSNVECRFLQDPYGISDLEFNLIDNWHRLNSSFYIKKYEKFIINNKRTYKLLFGKKWVAISKEYVDSLIQYKFKGYWHAEINEKPFFSRMVYKSRRAFSKLMPKKNRKTPDNNYFPRMVNYHTFISKEDFYLKTKKYVNDLCELLVDSKDDIVVLDQFVSTTNIQRYNNYADDLKIIIVDRDPRDLYLAGVSGKYKTHVLPHDVKIFCQQYIDIRNSLSKELSNKNVLKIQFEDLIYNYEDTTQKIIDFLELNKDNHVDKYKFFK